MFVLELIIIVTLACDHIIIIIVVRCLMHECESCYIFTPMYKICAQLNEVVGEVVDDAVDVDIAAQRCDLTAELLREHLQLVERVLEGLRARHHLHGIALRVLVVRLALENI